MNEARRGGSQQTQGVRLTAEQTARVPVAAAAAHLVGVRGPRELLGVRLVLGPRDTTLGRQADCDVTVSEGSVSRVHATVRREGESWVVLHRSRTNATYVNGSRVEERALLYHGDEIQLADSVAFRFDAPDAKRPPVAKEPSRPESLREAMEEHVELEELIERRFLRNGTFLDVDVVDSYGMKAPETRPDRIVVSFERFRELVEHCVNANRGQILNSNGDEVMAFFDSADDAVAGARDLVAGLSVFNRERNLLERAFEVRMGAHTGRSAVDLKSGIAYSPVVDLAGHLQKAAPVDGLLMSEQTHSALTRSYPAVKREDVSKSGVPAHELKFEG